MASQKRKKITGFALAVVLLLAVAGCIWYVNDYYHSDASAADFLADSGQVMVKQTETGLLFDGAGISTALIFYPGAKVEETAYAPLLYQIAEGGTDCFLVQMPFHLAILGKNKAADVINTYSYEHWYIAGHSLGGAMAASFASSHAEQLEGLILLAAYGTESISDTNLLVLSLYGSEDQVLNRAKLEAGRELMPQNYTEICIEGGNHAWFGNYGEQDGDGTAKISREEQQKQTVDAILSLITEKQ